MATARLNVTVRDVAGVLIAGGLGGLAGAFVVGAGIRQLAPLEPSRPELVVLVLSAAVVYLLAIVVHELGHAAGAALVRFRTVLFIAGPLRIEWRGASRRVALNRSIMLAGGLVASVPVGSEDLRRRTVVMVAGGPALSLVAGVQCLALWHATAGWLVGPRAAFPSQWLGVMLLLGGIASLLIGVITLLPTRAGGFYSDGARLLRLLRAGDDVEAEVALLALTGTAVSGERPRDWDSGHVRLAASLDDDGPFAVSARHYAFLHAFDRGAYDEARQHAAAVLATLHRMPRASRSSMLFGIATFRALVDDDPAAARTLAAEAGEKAGFVAPHQRALVEAAIHCAEGRHEAARSFAAEATRLAESAMDRGAAQLDLSLAAQIAERCASAA